MHFYPQSLSPGLKEGKLSPLYVVPGLESSIPPSLTQSASCRAGEGAFPETQEGVHREGGGDPEPVEEHRGSMCELVSHKGTCTAKSVGGGMVQDPPCPTEDFESQLASCLLSGQLSVKGAMGSVIHPSELLICGLEDIQHSSRKPQAASTPASGPHPGHLALCSAQC